MVGTEATGKRVIYVDFDDVLCETARAILGVAADRFNIRLEFEEIHSFSLEESFGLTPPQLEDLLEAVHAADVLGAMEPVNGAVDVLAGWAEQGYAVHVVTGRPPSCHEISHAWLVRHGVPFTNLEFVDKYGRPDTAASPVSRLSLDELVARQYCLAIDDSPVMLRFLAERMAMPVVVFDRPWNRAAPEGWPDDARFTRCRDWQQIAAAFPSP